MSVPSIYHTFQRYRTLQTDKITTLPIVILMPHSACNCKCVMCDIWKGNHNLRQLTEKDIEGLMDTLRKLGTRQVLMSGGEALLNPNFFRFCEILKKEAIKITLLSTGLSLKRHAAELVKWVDDIIVSLDGDEALHDRIRNIPGAFRKLEEGIQAVRAIDENFPITARTVIHRLNFRNWIDIIRAAAAIGIDRISFLPADVSSEAFNRPTTWEEPRQQEILPSREELPQLLDVIQRLIRDHKVYFDAGFIAESPEKINKIGAYYTASYGLNPYPYKKCNAPWVSTVVEADGTVRPCFFLPPLGNIHKDPLGTILNSRESVHFRKTLDMGKNSTCIKCVCYLNLSPLA
ncbi:MAG TPA: radical SAM protein [Puia sp.]|nr:radical SAM protein [Puia sp.]